MCCPLVVDPLSLVALIGSVVGAAFFLNTTITPALGMGGAAPAPTTFFRFGRGTKAVALVV